MKRCSKCQAENLDDAVFCDSCGSALSAAPATPPPPQPAASTPPAAAPTPSASKIKCNVCGAENDASYVFCENCGASLTASPPAAPVSPVPAQTPPPPAVVPVAPAPIQATPPPATPVAPPVTPPATVETSPALAAPAAVAAVGMIAASPSTQTPVAGHPRFAVASSGAYFDISNRTELLIGRVDPTSQVFPEIDLTAHGGDEGGVSRKHCRITLAGSQFFAEDLGSSNGTWINTTRLAANTRTTLNNGDQLRLGKLVLNFYSGY